MAIQGLRTTDNFVTDERPKNWRAGILVNEPNGSAPLFALTAAMRSESTDDPEFNWWEKVMQTRRFALGANLTASNTDITLAAGSTGLTLKEGDVLLVEQTQEVLLVSVDPTSNTSITVVRGFAGSTAASVDYDGTAINPNLVKVGSAYEEGSASPTSVAFDPTKRYNYTQIFRDSIEATNTAAATKVRTVQTVKEMKREALQLHAASIERAIFSGFRSEGTRNGKPHRTMGGIERFIDSGNIVTAGSTTDMATLEDWMYQMFRYGSSEKMVFTGNKALLVIQQIIRKNTSMQIFSGIKEFGMNVTRLVSPFGELVLKTHPLFNQQSSGTNAGSNAYLGMETWMWVLDMGDLKYRYMNGRDTKYEKDQQERGVDGMKAGWLTECALEVHHPLNHFLIKGLNAAAADA